MTVTYALTTQVQAIAIIFFTALAGGLVIGLIFGFQLPAFWKFPGYRFKPYVTKFQIPPLILMIILGCIARNLFTQNIMLAFNSVWS